MGITVIEIGICDHRRNYACVSASSIEYGVAVMAKHKREVIV